MATVGIDGVTPTALADFLLDRHGILTAPIQRDRVEGIRIAPSVYSTVAEIDRFADVMETVARRGLPA